MPSRTYWIGLDGEGLGRDAHRYTLLAVADSEGYSDYIEDMRGLSTWACLKWLLNLPARARVCGYYLGYDWTMILRDLPNKSIYKLFRPELRLRPKSEGGGFSPVIWRDFKLHYLAGTMRISRKGKRVTVWDVGKYYQAPFVTALEQSGIGSPDMIKRMKAERGTWNESDSVRVREYCLEECRYLSRLASRLERQHHTVGLNPTSWHGPGATASTVLRKQSIAQHRKELPGEVKHVAECAYFGGRFEHSTIGRYTSIYGYDLKSAYPAQAADLPCLAHGKWVRVRQESRALRTTIACIKYRVTDIGNRVWGPLPCRLANGNIIFSRGGHTGWAWQDEYKAAKEWPGVEYGGEAWIYKQECDCVPFEFVRKLFQARLHATTDDVKQILKLILNSLYGKLAQRIGDSPYASVVWAGLITSGTRARILDMILKHRDERAVLAIATDGIYSTEAHEPEAAGLGTWAREEYDWITLVRPGIYWTDHTVRARGMGRNHLSEGMATVEAAIARGDEGTVLPSRTQFGSARSTIYKTPRGDLRRSNAYGQWHDIPTRLSLLPAPKRGPDWMPLMLPDVESQPYGIKKGKDARLLELMSMLLAPD